MATKQWNQIEKIRKQIREHKKQSEYIPMTIGGLKIIFDALSDLNKRVKK